MCIYTGVCGANPLLVPATQIFPRFGDMEPEHVVPAIEERIKECSTMLSDLESSVANPTDVTYSDLAGATLSIEEHVSRPWSVASHLKSVMSSDALVDAHQNAQSKVVEFETKVSQSEALYKAWLALKDDPKRWTSLDRTQQRVTTLNLLSAELQGIGLEGAKKERFNEIKLRLAELSSTFNTNTVKATKAFALRLTTKTEVDGIPPSSLAAMAAAARERDDKAATAGDGPWVITLDGTSYMAVMKFASDRVLREKIYKAYVARASAIDQSEVDNEPIINETLALRKEKAVILGYASFAHLSMAMKMADLGGARDLLGTLLAKSKQQAQREHADLEAFAGRPLKNWDVGYYAEKLKMDRFSYDEETVKQYFTLDTVMTGLFGVVKQLFDVDVMVRDPKHLDAQIWHEDVKFLELHRNGRAIAYLYFDPYERNGLKRQGAWMNEVVGRSKTVTTPIAHIVTNFQAPSSVGAPCLLTFQQITTLFHEMGHALQHMLTEVDDGHVSGIRGVEWDAVEQPSQFMENFAYNPKNMKSMSKHHATGEHIPDELVSKIIASKNYRAASGMMRQLKFAMTDLALHDDTFDSATTTIWDVDREISNQTQILPVVAEDRFLCGFSHIFAGGYASGYFSYKWAEVLSAENFVAFEQAGLDDEAGLRRVGLRYAETVLGMGGSRPAKEIFKLFMGREPKVEALLRSVGITETA